MGVHADGDVPWYKRAHLQRGPLCRPGHAAAGGGSRSLHHLTPAEQPPIVSASSQPHTVGKKGGSRVCRLAHLEYIAMPQLGGKGVRGQAALRGFAVVGERDGRVLRCQGPLHLLQQCAELQQWPGDQQQGSSSSSSGWAHPVAGTSP